MIGKIQDFFRKKKEKIPCLKKPLSELLYERYHRYSRLDVPLSYMYHYQFMEETCLSSSLHRFYSIEDDESFAKQVARCRVFRERAALRYFFHYVLDNAGRKEMLEGTPRKQSQMFHDWWTPKKLTFRC